MTALGGSTTGQQVIAGEAMQFASPASMLRQFPLDQGAQRVLRAQFHYVAGDFGAALAELRQVAAEFADRRGMSVENLIARHGLKELTRLL